MKNNSPFHNKFKELREARGLKQSEVAKLIFTKPKVIGK